MKNSRTLLKTVIAVAVIKWNLQNRQFKRSCAAHGGRRTGFLLQTNNFTASNEIESSKTAIAPCASAELSSHR